MMTVMLSAAGSLRWFRDALAPGEDFGTLAAAAAEVARRQRRPAVPAVPDRASEVRTRIRWRVARSSASTIGHDRRHMTRAVLEGVAFGLRDGLDQMIAAGMPAPSQVRASGGGTASPLWRQILADVLGAELATVSTTEGAAYGAAMLAAVGAGWFESVEAAARELVRVSPAASPGPDVQRYAEAHEAYRELYPALAPIFHRTAERMGATAPDGDR